MSHQDLLKQEALKFLELVRDDVANEVVLTGSVARDMADAYSDIEFDLYNEVMPSVKVRENWLKGIGCTSIHVRPEAEGDGSEVIEFNYNDFDYELTWQTYEKFKKVLELKSSGEIDLDVHVTGWSCYFMQVLKDRDVAKNMIEEMVLYPPNLGEDIILDSIQEWYGSVTARVSSINRGEVYYSHFVLQKDIKKLVSLIYALNNRWEAYPKWLHHDLDNLEVLPNNFKFKFEKLFESLSDLKKAWNINIELLEDTFELLKNQNNSEINKEVIRITGKLKEFKTQIQ